MAGTNVASCVLSIVASFSSGIDVFKKFRTRQSRKKRRNRQIEGAETEELILAKSLRQGPEDIGREYRRNHQSVGDEFALGDAIAQSTLAEILLKLNTGLVTIINTFLERDEKRKVQIDYQSLTSLSEKSRLDTCRALRGLYRRLCSTRLPTQVNASARHEFEVVKQKEEARAGLKKKQNQSVPPKRTKKRGPTLARIVVQNSSKPSQIAMVKPAERRKKSSSTSNLSGSTRIASAPPTLPPSPLYSPPIEKAWTAPQRPSHHRSQTVNDLPRSGWKSSSTTLDRPPQSKRPDRLQGARSTPRLDTIAYDADESLPPPPKTTPLPQTETRRRKPTPTYYSVATNSTQIGEIPLHKWAEPYDFDAMSVLNREAMKSGWPLTEYDHVETKKKRGGLFRLFRKD